MPKPCKMLCDLEAPYTQSLMRLIETQSKATLANWALDYAERHYLPIYAAHFPQDSRPREALAAARDWLAGRVKLPALKLLILAAHAAAREAEAVPPAQAAARSGRPRRTASRQGKLALLKPPFPCKLCKLSDLPATWIYLLDKAIPLNQ